MNEEKVKKQIAILENGACLNWDEVDSETREKTTEELYSTLYYMRKEINEIIVELPLPLLARLARAIYILSDIQENLDADVQEEIEMYLLYENIGEKIEEHRNLPWTEILRYK